MTRHASQQAYASLRHSEGLRLVAYPDPGTGGDPWTIGYGSTRGVVKGMRINKAEAEARLEADVMEAEGIVNSAVKVPLSQSQFDALTCFAFNVRAGRKGVSDGWVTLKNGQPSTLLRRLNAGDYDAVPEQMRRWNKAGGRVMAGLVTRRDAEAAMFVADDVRLAYESDAVTPSPDAPTPKAMQSSRTMQGAGIAGVATIGGGIVEQTQQLAPAAEVFPWLKAAFALLALVGVCLVIYGRLRIARDEGV